MIDSVSSNYILYKLVQESFQALSLFIISLIYFLYL